MTAFAYTTQDGRINEVKGEMLAHAIHIEVLDKGCKMKKMPRKQGDNISYRRALPFGAATTNVNTQNRPAATATAHIVQEGVTPDADNITYQDVNVVQQQYACLYAYTDKTAELYEDDVPEDMRVQSGERMGLVREMVRFGEIKSCTNVIYAGGTSRATVDEALKKKHLGRMTRILKSNHAQKKTRILKASPDYDTSAIRASFMVFSHSDVQQDIEDIPGFTPVEKYASFEPISDYELGATPDYRFLLSPELAPYADAGAAVGSSNLVSTTGTNIDVYPVMQMGEDAVFDVALRGLNSFTTTHLPHNKPDKSDPGGQRGYLYCGFWGAVKITNGGWMGVTECGVTDLST